MAPGYDGALPLLEAAPRVSPSAVATPFDGRVARWRGGVATAAGGEHPTHPEFLAAPARGQVGRATRDVFPTSHRRPPLFDHPRVAVTPHVAPLLGPVAGGEAIAAEPVPDLVDLAQGYCRRDGRTPSYPGAPPSPANSP